MKTKTTETKKTNETVTYSTFINDDDGVSIAKMSATVNNSTPFGNVSFVVLNKSKFEENKEELRKVYLEFEEEVSCTDLNNVDTTSEKEGDILVAGNPETVISNDVNDTIVAEPDNDDDIDGEDEGGDDGE